VSRSRSANEPAIADFIFAAANLAADGSDPSGGIAGVDGRKYMHEDRVACAAGSGLGGLDGAALGIGAGLIRVEVFQTGL
jgi:hypothetical protein